MRILKIRVLIIVLMIVITFLPGCAKSGQGSKKLGKDAAAALKSKNLDDYMALCLTIKDKKYLIAASDLTLEEKKAQTALISTTSSDIYKTKETRTANFNDIASVEGWENAIVHKVVLGKYMDLHGIIGYEDIIVKFKGSLLPDLKIGKVVRVKDVWKIMDDNALSFKSMI